MVLQIANAIDMHCHFAEDTLGTLFSQNGMDMSTGTPIIETVREAVAQGQAGVVLKSHAFGSPAIASLLSEMEPRFRAFGGLCLDHITGGLNVDAVDAALRMGAKVVWLPTINSAQGIPGDAFSWFTAPPIHVIDEEGDVLPALKEIFDLIRQHDAVLATGHVTADEHYAVVRSFAKQGKVLVTHAGEEVAGPNLSKAQAVELADLGASVEFVALNCGEHGPLGPGRAPEKFAEMIAAIGAERCVLSSDLGWAKELERPVPGFQNFLEKLWKDGGVSEADLEIMSSRNPAELLGVAL